MGEKKNLNEMTPEELGLLFPIIISDPDPRWPEYFDNEKRNILNLFQQDQIIAIDHIGSTAIPKLKAKPTIDILIQIADNLDKEIIIENLVQTGYHYIPRPENPPPHMMFTKGYTKEGFRGQAFHIHIRYKDDWDEIYFRDYLRENWDTAKEYEVLKIRLAAKYEHDRDGYTDAKTGFVKGIVNLARKR